MKQFTRRSFLETSALAAGSLMASDLLTASHLLAAQEREKYGGTLRIAIRKDAKSLDSRYLSWGWESNPGFQQIYEQLTQYGPKMSSESVPALAESWEQLDDVTWIVRIRKGAKFHHGGELTAESVKTLLDWTMKTPKGWRNIRRGPKALGGVKKLELLDKYTLKFTLKEPDVLFVPYVMRWATTIAPPDLIEKWGKEFSIHPTGTGPFKFVQWQSGSYIIIERFDGYWGKKPYLDRVIFMIIPDGQTRLIALQKGEVDIADLELTSASIIQKDPNFTLHKVQVVQKVIGGGIFFNMRRWPMDSLKFRQAVAMGADWEKLAQKAVPNNMALIQRSLLKGSEAYDPKMEKIVPRYNPEKARMLVRELETEAGRRVPPLYALTRDYVSHATILNMAANQLKSIGVNMDLHIMPYEVANDKYRRDPRLEWDVALWAPVKGTGLGAIYFLEDFRGKADSGQENTMGYSNPRVDEIVQQVRSGRIKDKKKLRELCQQAERIILTDLPYLPVWDEPILYGVNKRVHDFIPHDVGWINLVSPYNNIWIDKK